MPDLLEVCGVRKTYGSFALEEVSLNLRAGYMMGLIGPNGAGKTTLIKMIMNAVRCDGGTIRLLGAPAGTPIETLKEGVGFVQDEPTFYGYLSLARMKTIIAGFYPSWDEAAFRSLIDRFGLSMSQRISSLSRGMLTKFSLSLALSHGADLIVLDEPTSGLDPASRRDLLTLLAEYIEDGRRSVLFSTHIVSDLERVADYVTLLQAGRVVFSSAKDEILESWAVVRGGAGLLDTPVREYLHGWQRHEHGVEALTSRSDELRAIVSGDVLVERASFEDIMFYTSPRHGAVPCSP